MNFFAGIETFLYIISTALYYPVLISIVILTFWICLYLGSFIREYVERKRGNFFAVVKFRKLLEEIIKEGEEALEPKIERLLQKIELELIKSLDKIKFAIRVGPALGLMATLIPMGIALSALAQGDLPKMAGSMVTAFTATTVGLACGVSAYLISLVKEKWIRADIREMEYLSELIFAKCSKEKQSFREKIYEVLEEE